MFARVRDWRRQHGRDLPWLATRDPYAVWVSEIMLQQTVVAAVLPRYQAWLARWPDLIRLADAREDQVLAAWEGLGYASRARNLLRAAGLLVARGERTLPADYTRLRELPGVGDYTASALLAFAFDQPALTLDANLKRLFQRLDAVPAWTKPLEARWRALWPSLLGGASRDTNLAAMLLGQQVCTARKPRCGECPLRVACQAHAEGLQDTIPARAARVITEVATRVVRWRNLTGQTWLARPLQGRFSTLWLLPPFPEGERGTDLAGPPATKTLSPRVHTYTRYRDRLSPVAATWDSAVDPPLPPGWEGRWMDAAEAASVGMVSVYRKILDEVPLDGGTGGA